MKYPKFFNDVPNIVLQDDLANFLGSVDDGIISYSYLDIVKIAGHSCPTVLGIYMMIYKSLKTLYIDEIPKRGEIKIEFQNSQDVGVTGVMANIATAITGATTGFGFKGLNGKFNRCELMEFNTNINGLMKVTRVDLNKSVVVNYDTSSMQRPERLNELMQKSLQGTASLQEQKEFGVMWQQGVENIFKNINNFITLE